jgi:hypothetical protein
VREESFDLKIAEAVNSGPLRKFGKDIHKVGESFVPDVVDDLKRTSIDLYCRSANLLKIREAAGSHFRKSEKFREVTLAVCIPQANA